MLAAAASMVQELQDGLAGILDMALMVVDPQGNAITRISDPAGFCTLLMGSPLGRARCDLSHKEAVGLAHEEVPLRCHCYAGLVQFVAPVLVRDVHMATALIGVLPASSPDTGRIRKLAYDVRVSGYELLRAARRIKGRPDGIFTENAIRLFVGLLQAITESCYERNELTGRVKGLLTLYEVGRTVDSTRNLEEILHTILDKAISVVNGEAGSIMLLDEGRGELTIKAARGLTREAVRHAGIRLGEGIAGWVAQHGEPLLLLDPTSDPRFCHLSQREEIKSALCVPLKVKDKVVGVLNVNRLAGETYAQDDLDLVYAIGREIATVVENARLYKYVDTQRHILQQLVAKTIQAQEDERRLVALEIHDVISQAVASLFYRIQTCERLLNVDIVRAQGEFYEIKRMAQQTLDDVTRLMFNLRPPILDDLGVLPALRRYIDQYERENGIPVKMEVKGRRRRFDPSVEVTIYRIIQEALTNVRRHAQARQVIIRFEISQGEVRGVVEDNGKGFDPVGFLTRDGVTGHLGLLGMRERAVLLGGTLDVKSKSGEGTAISFKVPVFSRDRTGGGHLRERSACS